MEELEAQPEEEIRARIEALKADMRPVQQQLDELRVRRDLLLTELRRRERTAGMLDRRDLKAAMRTGELPSVADLVAGTDSGTFEDYVYNLRTGGEVRLGFPGARTQSVAFTDGRQVAQARDFSDCARLHGAGWELGAPGKPGLRVNFPGTRTERLVDAGDVFARPASG